MRSSSHMQEGTEPQSPGAQYLPEAFEPESYEVGRRVAEDLTFYHAFVQYIVSLIADPAQLVHFRATILNEVLRISHLDLKLSAVAYSPLAPTQFPVVAEHDAPQALRVARSNLTSISWCAMSLVTDKYFAETARLCGCS